MTVQTLDRCLPPAMPGVTFLSGASPARRPLHTTPTHTTPAHGPYPHDPCARPPTHTRSPTSHVQQRVPDPTYRPDSLDLDQRTN